MRTRSLKSNHPLALRLIAVVCLLVWSSALIACAADCGNFQKPAGCCHKKTSGNSREKTFCLHSQPVARAQTDSQILKPDFALCQNFVTELQVTALELEPLPVSLRPSARADFVFTPELCLGAAFRSLAPPVLP